MNHVFLIGHLGKDPEMRSTNDGKPVANVSLATSRRWRDAQGNKQEETEWHDLVAFGKTAEVFAKYTRKGSQLSVRGRLRTRSWDDQQSGQKRYRTEIIVEELKLLDKAGGNGGGNQGGGYGGPSGSGNQNQGGGNRGGYGGNQGQNGGNQSWGNQGPPQGGGWDPGDDDIPF